MALFMQSEGITNADEMIDLCRRQARTHMNIDLLLVRDLIGCAEMQQVARSTALWKVSRILDKRVHGFAKLPVQEKRGLVRVRRSPGVRPVYGQLAGGGPIVRELARPRQLQARVVSVT